MTDPTLTEQLEMERLELEQMLAAEDVKQEPEPEQPDTKWFYVPNRHDRRKAAAKARKNKTRKP